MADNNTLYVDLSKLKGNVSMLRNMERSMESINSTLKNLSGEAGEFWAGRTFNVFKNNQKVLINKIEEMKAQVNNCRQDLEQSIAVYERVETENTRAVEDLSVNDIF